MERRVETGARAGRARRKGGKEGREGRKEGRKRGRTTAKAVIARPSLYRMSVGNRIVVSRLRALLLFDHLLDPAPTPTPFVPPFSPCRPPSLSHLSSIRVERKEKRKKKREKEQQERRSLHCVAAGRSEIEISTGEIRGSRYVQRPMDRP